ncbi:DUF1449 domain-containing protein [Pantanalinema rosaneae]|uniref:DUF1449 domain-containing protein n=1 Tax=Pantanalinema rosaneae TaxID=1620701 RepID=UPI003D6FDC52
MGILLFLTVILTGGGDDDLDADVDQGLLDLDAETDSDFSATQILAWLGFGKAPLVLLLATDLSLIGVLGWLLNVVVGVAIGQVPAGLWSGFVLATTLFLSLTLGSLIARPVGKVFAQFGEDASSDRLIGCIGTVSSASLHHSQENRIAQVDVLDPARNLVSIATVLPDWATTIPRRGDKVVVIDRQGSYYLVIAKDSADSDRWFNNPPPSDS